MATRFVRITVSLSFLLGAAHALRAAVTGVEDLTGCRLPNGRVVLPVAGTPAASSGPMYKFATNTFSALPAAADGKPLSLDEALARLRDSRSADLQFLPEKQGSLWAFSGAITEVPGAFYLADLSGKKLDEPWPIPKTSTNLAGQCQNIAEGSIFLLKTTDARFVLLRVLEKSPASVTLQYVYQPAGTLTFDIPANPKLSYNATSEAPAGPHIPLGPAVTNPTIILPATAPASRPALDFPPPARPQLGPNDINENGVIRLLSPTPPAPISRTPPSLAPPAQIALAPTTPLPSPPAPAPQDPSVNAFIQQRTALLQSRLDILAAPARTPAEIDRKTQAAADLAALRADEPQVADLLVSQIAFFNPQSQIRDFSPDALYPCFAALKRMGKPATPAALNGVRKLDLDTPGDGIDSAVNKAVLLGMVVRAVEGNEAADALFRRQAAGESDPKRRAVFEFLLTK